MDEQGPVVWRWVLGVYWCLGGRALFRRGVFRAAVGVPGVCANLGGSLRFWAFWGERVLDFFGGPFFGTKGVLAHHQGWKGGPRVLSRGRGLAPTFFGGFFSPPLAGGGINWEGVY